jgi:c-di-AMP phosphodiesterase-like protein
VEASFALIRLKNAISISGRSHGHINVQLILEELKGGGHYDSAGAQLDTTDMAEALALLKRSIEKFKENKH